MRDAGLDTMRRVESVCEIPPGAGVLQLLQPGMAVRAFIEHCCVEDGVAVMCGVISAMPELFHKEEGVEC